MVKFQQISGLINQSLYFSGQLVYHDEARYIGMIDTKLNWDKHLQHVLGQADRQIFAKKRSRRKNELTTHIAY